MSQNKIIKKRDNGTDVPIVLLMTASIDPRGCVGAKFSVERRREQYLKAFKFYLNKLRNKRGGYQRILFCENSGADLTEFKALVPKNLEQAVEFFSPNPNLFDGRHGKGYNEFLLIDLACDQCQFLSSQNALFLKVTGRYSILNIKNFVNDCKKRLPRLDCFCDTKDHDIFKKLGLNWGSQWCDTRIIAFRVSFWKSHFYGHCSTDLVDSKWWAVEPYVFERLLQERSNPRVAFRFSSELFIRGLNGSAMVILRWKIPESLQPTYFFIRAMIKTFFRRLFPNIWF